MNGNALKSKNQRPVIKINRTLTENILDGAAAAGLLVSIIMLVLYWPKLPKTIPTHFGFSGLPDAWGDRGALLIPVAVCFILYLLLTVISRFPHTFNYLWKVTEDNARVQYILARSLLGFLKTEIIWVFTYIQWRMIQVSLGQAAGLGTGFLPVSLAVIFGTLALYFFRSWQEK